jgi:hypothetical protein
MLAEYGKDAAYLVTTVGDRVIATTPTDALHSVTNVSFANVQMLAVPSISDSF